MTLRSRRFLYIVFIASFLMITPLVILYANGYQLSLDQNHVVKTGTLILNTKPTGAKIYLNSQPQQTFISQLFKQESFVTTPAKINNILPGDYNVSIEKTGYWSWKKKITINPGESTYAEDILLFLNSQPNKLTTLNAKTFSVSPNNDSLAFADDKELKIINEKNNDSIVSLNQPAKTISWSKDGIYFLADKKIFKTSDQTSPIDLQKIAGPSLKNIIWDLNDSSIFYYNNKNGLSSYNLSSQTNSSIINNSKAELFKLITSSTLNAYFIKDGNIYLIENVKTSTQFKIFDLTSGKLIRTIGLPKPSNYQFISQENKLINLYNQDAKSLYLIDPLSYNPIVTTINNYIGGYWINDNKLIFHNDYEVLIFDLNLKTEILYTRISDQINNVFWHPSNNYIIYVTSNSIYSFELDQREKHNTIKLTETDGISSSFLNAKGDALYFSGAVKSEQGLYKLLLQ